MAYGHRKYHCRYHVRDGEILDPDYSEASGYKKNSSAGLEIIYHGRTAVRVDNSCKHEQQHKYDDLRDSDKACHNPQAAGKYKCSCYIKY